MSETNKLEDCKKEIRSILIPFQKGCLLSEFNRSYYEFIGRRLPIKEFGFRADIEFLYSMPDVVKITPTRSGEYHLTAVADETVKHIQKMVARQKPTKSKSSSRFSKPSRLNYDVPPRLAEMYRRQYESTFEIERKFPVPKLQPKVEPKLPPRLEQKLPPKSMSKEPIKLSKITPVVSKITPSSEPRLPPKASPKEEVIALVQYFDNRIAFDNLLPEYKRLYQKDLSLAKYGFSSLKECIEDIPELYLENINRCTFVMYHPESPDASDMNENYNVPGISVFSGRQNHQNYAEDSVKRSLEAASTLQSKYSSNQNGNKAYVPDSLRGKLQMVYSRNAERFTQGIKSSAFPSCFEEVTGAALDLHSLGYRCLNDLIDDFPDIFTRQPVAGSKMNYIIYSANKSGPELNRSTASSDDSILSGTKILHHVIANLRKILEAYPEGISLQEFSHIYSINYSDTLNVHDFGFDDVETFLSSIKKQVPLLISSVRGTKTIHMLQEEHLPPDVADLEFKFKLQALPKNFDFSKYFPVYTSSVAHPGHLYIQLQGEETVDALVQLAENIETFYTGSDSKLYTMKNNHIQIGASCVAKWLTDNHWYRAEIFSIPNTRTVQVHYVDYGTRDTVSNVHLRYLKKDFIDLPAQALKCRLAFLKPAKNAREWSIESRNRILNMCEDVSLMAKIEEIGHDDIYSILLCDTNGEEDVYINDVLCNEGLAEYAVGETDPSFGCDPVHQVVPKENHHNLNPLQALQAQYFLQAFVTVAPSFAENENYKSLLREVTMCSNPDRGRQNVNIPSATAVAPPGFNAFLLSGMYGNSSVPFEAFSAPSPALELSSVASSPEKTKTNFINPPTPVASSADSETVTVPKSVGISTEEREQAECEIFDDDDDDEIFQEFCEKISLPKMRCVKRVILGEGYKIHIIVFESKPFASSGDISQLIWNNKEADYLFRRLQLKDVDIPSLTVSEVGNEELFQQLEKFCVKGVQKTTGCKASILLFPLRVVIKILNIFGHPSVTLRTKLTEEIANFDPHSPDWMDVSSPEPLEPEEDENASGVTDDDKIEKLCLFDLLAMKESVTLRKKKMMASKIKSDEMEKLDQLHQKVLQRIREIKEICSVFS